MTVEQAIKCYDSLKRLKKAKSKQEIKQILQNSPKCINKVLSEIAKEILRGNIRLTKLQKQHLKPFKNQVRRLARRNKSFIKINQQGSGLLPLLLGPAIALLTKAFIEKL